MSKTRTFESDLAEVQSEMISVALEYVNGNASDIYIYCATEGGVFQFDPFFVVDGKVVERHKVPGVDASVPRQRSLIRFGTDQLLRLAASAKEHSRPLPTQIKIHYLVNGGAVDSSFEYVPQYTNSESLTAADMVERWQADVAAELSH
ncbi:hypothetical protein QFZ53_002819 [Microbacterium natoriense]|uniref:Histidine kinase n=1 Tax=Microbacterium natoriense TaxID=284570 RepID=A0AAW8EZF6_9MICO|nr:hypothetical protein [Microbacterium natoriense]MDQ0648623.1 hypothetical protein [Microbacterium natoriense]